MKRLGFGCMRLPLIDEAKNEVDHEEFQNMIDMFMEKGYTYFDTAHVYLDGNSETAIREDLVKRYPRDSFVLADKLSGSCFETEADIRPLFKAQLEACGVTYFDYYLMHSLTAKVYGKFTDCHAFDVARELKEEGKIKHIGISFHDKPELLEKILTDHPEIEVVQIQLNYFDYDSPVIQSGALYDVCCRFEKPVIVMEPVRGGILARLPKRTKKLFCDLEEIGTPASYAIRYVASFPKVFMVLSGMSDTEQMDDNLATMECFEPLSYLEREILHKVRKSMDLNSLNTCTGCRYCVPGCPMNIPIPDLFACADTKMRFRDWGSDFYYETATEGKGKASDCIGCRQCESICPQHIEVTEKLKDVVEIFEQTGEGTLQFTGLEEDDFWW